MKDREIAVQILKGVTTDRQFANRLLSEALQNADDRTGRLVRRLVYGTLDHLETIDPLIDSLNRSKRKRLDPTIRNILRVSVYQLLYLDRLPSFAVINEAVQMAKKVNPRYGGFVNGMLRTVDRMESKTQESPFPEVIEDALLVDYTEEEIEALMLSSREVPYLCIRYNPLRVEKGELIRSFGALGMDLVPSALTHGVYRVMRPDRVIDTDMYAEGWFTVQDEAAASVVPYADPKPGEAWLDLCAAPGGKSTQLAEHMGDQGHVLACDLYENKVERIAEHAKRLGLHSLQTRVSDAAAFHPEFVQSFDGVLLDAPCSGLGLLRRKPDIKYNRTKEQFAELQNLQAQMLDHAAHYVKPGGVLVYSTCTILSCENQAQIERFLRDHKDFSPRDDRLDHRVDMVATMADGFYMTALRKTTA